MATRERRAKRWKSLGLSCSATNSRARVAVIAGTMRAQVQRAVADVGPAVLVGMLAGRRQVLEVDGDDPFGMAVEPRGDVLAGPGDPADVGLPQQRRRGFQHQVERRQAIARARELEVVVVPGEPDSVPGERRLQAGQGVAQRAPAGRVLGALRRWDRRDDQQRRADRPGRLHDGVEVAGQRVEPDMAARRRDAMGAQGAAQHVGVGEHGAVGLDLPVAERRERRQLRLERREVARRVELERESIEHGHRGVLFAASGGCRKLRSPAPSRRAIAGAGRLCMVVVLREECATIRA